MAALLLPGLFGGGEGWGLGCGEDGGGFLGDAGAFEEVRVLRAPQPHRVRKPEVAEITGGDVAVFDQLEGLGQGIAHVDHVEMPNVGAPSPHAQPPDCVHVESGLATSTLNRGET
jgi:hypothetical protein